jgi:hypothetical protein
VHPILSQDLCYSPGSVNRIPRPSAPAPELSFDIVHRAIPACFAFKAWNMRFLHISACWLDWKTLLLRVSYHALQGHMCKLDCFEYMTNSSTTELAFTWIDCFHLPHSPRNCSTRKCLPKIAGADEYGRHQKECAFWTFLKPADSRCLRKNANISFD